MGEPTTLYRMYDEAGVLLYVGVTATVRGATRFGEHAKRKWWWPDVQALTVEHYKTREAAESAERQAIQTEGPLHNIVHNRRPHRVEPAAPTIEAFLVEVHRQNAAFDDALGEVVQLLIELGRADEPCIDCGAIAQPHSWDRSGIFWQLYAGEGLLALYRCRCDPADPCSTWWEQPRRLPEIENVTTLDEMVLLRDQLKAKAEHGTPMIAPEVELVLAGLAARWPRVD